MHHFIQGLTAAWTWMRVSRDGEDKKMKEPRTELWGLFMSWPDGSRGRSHEAQGRRGECLVILTGSAQSIIKVHEKDNGDTKFLTKGDNNAVDDRGLYKEGQNWLEKKVVEGRVRGSLLSVCLVTIIMRDYTRFKYALVAAMGTCLLLKHES
uniref:Uncharacterized protein n=1 Tax=Equus caballus TaxID=9796 RepID=A0A3Q2HX04_HORSE